MGYPSLRSPPESNVNDLSPEFSFRRFSSTSRSIKSTSSTAGQSGTISPHLSNRGLNTNTTGPSVPRTSPTVGFNGLLIPPSTVPNPITTGASKRNVSKPKGLKQGSKLFKFANSKHPSKYITSATNVVPLSSVPKVQASPPNPGNTTGAGSPPNNNSNTEASTNLQSKKRNYIDTSPTYIQDKPSANSQEAKKRKTGY